MACRPEVLHKRNPMRFLSVQPIAFKRLVIADLDEGVKSLQAFTACSRQTRSEAAHEDTQDCLADRYRITVTAWVAPVFTSGPLNFNPVARF